MERAVRSICPVLKCRYCDYPSAIGHGRRQSFSHASDKRQLQDFRSCTSADYRVWLPSGCNRVFDFWRCLEIDDAWRWADDLFVSESLPGRCLPAFRTCARFTHFRLSLRTMIIRNFQVIILSGCLACIRLHAGQPDWLLDGSSFKAEITASADGREVKLDNGLIRRALRLSPNAATVSFENLMTGEQFLRAVRPEAILEMDGVHYNIGGLSGQPIQNFLKKDWVDQLESDPGAFQFIGYTTGKTEARFPWKKRREWMAKDAPWPAPGVSLTLEFQSPDNFPGGAQPRGAILLADDFTKLSPEWKLSLSSRNPRTSFQNEGKVGEIMALENTHAFAERSWPAGGEAVECQVDPGTDKSASWGPGLGLVFANGVVERFYLRPGHSNFGLDTPDNKRELGRTESGRPYLLRMTLRGNHVICEASTSGIKWESVGDMPSPGEPTAVRIGKMSINGDVEDFSEGGALERCILRNFQIYGPIKKDNRAKQAADSSGRVKVEVHYELFDGMPLISKWFVVKNQTKTTIRLNTFVSEVLALTEAESNVGGSPRWELPKLLAETDYSFGGAMGTLDTMPSVHWMRDPTYTSQVNYDLQTPCLLQTRPPIGPDQDIAPGATFESFRAFELAQDSTERERKSLAKRRMYRTIAPWTTENPIFMHVRSADPQAVKFAVDQCAEVGFEMMILTFGSGFDFESRDTNYHAGLKELVDYAKSKGVVLGGYSLCSSRNAGTEADNVVGSPVFGVAPCLGSSWGQAYLEQLKHMMQTTGLSVLEHDGSYPGDTCAATNHPYHHGKDDSQWVQWKAITDLYKWCRAKGVYLNVPDWYYLSGSSKCGMGYREVNWSLPREDQEIIERQNIFDGTWDKMSSMGWMFVPLTEYQGGGAAATIEPLKDHLAHYEQRLENLFGTGVMACYRGPRLYDTDETKAVVKRWVDFYKKHREVLDSDFLHLRRADGCDLDYILHVNPSGNEKGLLMVYNPINEEASKTLRIPLYYTGKTTTASVSERDSAPKRFVLDRAFNIELPVKVPAHGVNWFVIE